MDLVGGPPPVLGRKAEQREVRDAELADRLYRLAHRVGAAAMAGNTRQTAGPRPAAVAIHDDRNVPRQGARRMLVTHQTCRISLSFCASVSSMRLMCSSVRCWTSFSSLRCSSCEISPSFSRR